MPLHLKIFKGKPNDDKGFFVASLGLWVIKGFDLVKKRETKSLKMARWGVMPIEWKGQNFCSQVK